MAESEDEIEPESERHLPEVLVEKIVAEVPFPHILKARTLSREWKAKLSRVMSTQPSGRTWQEYFPSLVCKGRVEGYDAAMNCIKRMGGRNVKAGGARDAMGAVCGTLLVSLDITKPEQPIATMISLLTCQRRKIICPEKPSNDFLSPPPSPIVNPNGPDHYELVLWFFGEGYDFTNEDRRSSRTTLVNHYDSRSRTWTEKTFRGEHVMISRFSAFLDGSLYCISEVGSKATSYQDYTYPPRILRFDTRNDLISETAQIELEDKIHGKWFESAAVRCGSRIMAVVFEKNLVSPSSHVKIFELDTRSFALMELSRSPLDMECGDGQRCTFITVVASTNRVHILQRDKRILTTYAPHSNTWTTINSVPDKFFYTYRGSGVRCFVFEPNLNPFIAA